MEDPEVLRFQRALAYHCAPALTGIKPADLFSWAGEAQALSEEFTWRLSGAGVSIRLLCRRGGRGLILAYRPRRLEEQLGRGVVRAQLRRDGYPVDGGVEKMLDRLGERLRAAGAFPHEVGLFLGYPAADVEGFRKYGGRSCKLSGLWKVYGDAEWAGRYFEQCRRCRAELSRRVAGGCALADLLPGMEPRLKIGTTEGPALSEQFVNFVEP